MKRILLSAMAIMASLMLYTTAHAQDVESYPSQTIKIIVPYSAGGGVDTLARMIAEQLEGRWGQTVVVENVTGAGGNIGAATAYRADPDGYTLFFTAGGVLVTNQLLYAELGFDPEKFVPISVVAASYSVLVVNPEKVPANSVQELIDLAKANPDKFNYASPGVGTGSHLTAEQFKLQADVKIAHIPYRGTSPALTDVLGGQVGIMFAELGSVLPHVQAGTVRALAVTSAERHPSLPDVPALSEILPGFLATPWNGLVAPPETPMPIAKKISSAIAVEFNKPATVKRINDIQKGVIANTPEEMAEFMKQERERWEKVVRVLLDEGTLTVRGK